MTLGLRGLWGMILCVGGILLYFKIKYPDYFQQSGMPPLLPALLFGIPGGLIAGRISNLIWPPKNPKL